jgi:hypothetical protein
MTRAQFETWSTWVIYATCIIVGAMVLGSDSTIQALARGFALLAFLAFVLPLRAEVLG